MNTFERVIDSAEWYWFIFWYMFGAAFIWKKLLGRAICPWFGHKWQILSKLKKDWAFHDDADLWFEPSDISNCKRCGLLNEQNMSYIS